MCKHSSQVRVVGVLTATGNFVVPLQVQALEPFPAASAGSLNYPQMSLVHMTSEPIPPYDRRTSSPGALHFLLTGYNPRA
ncbi:hypothetical protein M405DRAFT_817955, partial [Rhizopogon salebrosus TDB-379]